MKVADLRKHKDDLYSSLCRDLAEFEKNFLLITAGIFTFSITFLKDVLKPLVPDYLAFLFIGWAMFVIAIGLMMFAFLKSSWESDKIWKVVDDFILQKELHKDDEDLSKEIWQEIKNRLSPLHLKAKRSLKILRIASVASFLTGIIFLSLFVGNNFRNIAKKNTNEVNSKPIKNGKAPSPDSTIQSKTVESKTTTSNSAANPKSW